LCFLTRRHFFRLLFPTRTTPHRQGRPGGDTTRTLKNRRKRKEKRKKERSTTGWRAGKMVEGEGQEGRRSGRQGKLRAQAPAKKEMTSRRLGGTHLLVVIVATGPFVTLYHPRVPQKAGVGKGKGGRRRHSVEVRGEVPAWDLLRVLGLGQTWGRAKSFKTRPPPFHVRVIARTRPYKHQSHVQISRSHAWARKKRRGKWLAASDFSTHSHVARRRFSLLRFAAGRDAPEVEASPPSNILPCSQQKP
jgi:hypothetical protein